MVFKSSQLWHYYYAPSFSLETSMLPAKIIFSAITCHCLLLWLKNINHQESQPDVWKFSYHFKLRAIYSRLMLQLQDVYWISCFKRIGSFYHPANFLTVMYMTVFQPLAFLLCVTFILMVFTKRIMWIPHSWLCYWLNNGNMCCQHFQNFTDRL